MISDCFFGFQATKLHDQSPERNTFLFSLSELLNCYFNIVIAYAISFLEPALPLCFNSVKDRKDINKTNTTVMQ